MFRLSSEELTPRDHGMSAGDTTATTTHIPPLSLGLSHSQALANANLAAALGRSGSGTAAGGYKDAAGRAGAGAGAGALMDLHGSSAAGMGVGRSPDAELLQQHLRQQRGAGRGLAAMEGLDALASAAAAAEQDEGMATAAAAAKDAAAAAAAATGTPEAAKLAPGKPAGAAAAGQGAAGLGAGLQPSTALASGFAVPSAGGLAPADPRLRFLAATAASVNPSGPGLGEGAASNLEEGARKVLGAEAAGPGSSGAAAAPSGSGDGGGGGRGGSGGGPVGSLGQGGRVVVVVRGAALTPASGSESDASTPSHSREGSPERRRGSPGGHDDAAPDGAHGSLRTQRWGHNQHEQLLDRQGSSPGNNAARPCAGAGGSSPDARRQPAAEEAAAAAAAGEGGDGGVGGVKRSREEAGLDAGVGAEQCEARRKLSSQAQDV